jgi:hypothetical protein
MAAATEADADAEVLDIVSVEAPVVGSGCSDGVVAPALQAASSATRANAVRNFMDPPRWMSGVCGNPNARSVPAEPPVE